MTTVRITKLERDARGFYTANVTAAGADTVRVDNAIGCWTIAKGDPGDRRQNRREVLPWCVALLQKRVRAYERGDAAVERDDHAPAKNGRPKPANAPTPFTPQQVGAAMAQAGANAIKEAA